MARPPKDTAAPSNASTEVEAGAPVDPSVEAPTGRCAAEHDLIELRQRVAEQDRLIADQARSMKEQGTVITELRDRLDQVDAKLEQLGRAHPKGIIATTPVPLTSQEAIDAMAKDSSVRFVALLEYAPLGLRPGDKFEGRQRFEGPRVVGSHVVGGLKIAIAA
jgi:uncharacterized coiled-coil protein SlyX